MKNVRKTVDKILNVCILVLFIAMFGVTTLNVIMRYIFNSPLSFAVEFGRYTFAGMVYLGSIYVMRETATSVWTSWWMLFRSRCTPS